jgi:hypothetical protein
VPNGIVLKTSEVEEQPAHAQTCWYDLFRQLWKEASRHGKGRERERERERENSSGTGSWTKKKIKKIRDNLPTHEKLSFYLSKTHNPQNGQNGQNGHK